MILPESEELTLKTGGMILGGWQEFRITRGVDRLPSSFDITLTERNSSTTGKAVVEPGATCEAYLSKTKILTGYIDRYMPSYNKQSHQVRIIGRSRTADVVDCMVDTEKLGTWAIKSGTIGEAARRLVAPYGITVKLPDGDPALPTGQVFSIYPGYTTFFLIEEMARSVGMLVWDDPAGDLLITKGGTGGHAASALVEGQNIEAASAMLSMDQRFSKYKVVVIGPHLDDGHYALFGEDQDAEVTRDRLWLIPAEAPITKEAAQARATWEKTRRLGRSKQTAITVSGWRDSADQLWTPNMMVSTSLPELKVTGDRVIASVTWYRGQLGTLTYLTLMPVEGLAPQPFFPILPVPKENPNA